MIYGFKMRFYINVWKQLSSISGDQPLSHHSSQWCWRILEGSSSYPGPPHSTKDQVGFFQCKCSTIMFLLPAVSPVVAQLCSAQLFSKQKFNFYSLLAFAIGIWNSVTLRYSTITYVRFTILCT